MSENGISVKDLLLQVSQQTGRDYRVIPALAPEVVAVQVQVVEIEEFESHLARALGARWQVQGETKRLEFDPAVEVAEAEARRAAWMRALEKVRESRRNRLAKLPNFDAKTAESMLRRVDDRIAKNTQNSEFGLTDALNREGNLPIDRLLARLLTTLPTETFVNLTPNSRRVYAQRPNARQRPLPSAANAAIQAFLQEEATWEAAQASFRAQSSKTSEIAGLPVGGKVVLVVQCDENGDGGAISAAVVGPDGKNAMSAVVGIEDWDEEASARRFVAPKPVQGETPVAESEAAILMRKLCQKWPDAPRSNAKLTPAVSAILRNPVGKEPLAYVPGELWSNTARDRKRNLIANLTDSDFDFVPDPAEGPRTPSTVLQRVALAHRVEEDEKWLTIFPKNFTMERLNRLDRALNQTLLLQAIAKGGYQLEDAASFRANHPNGYPFYEWPNGYLYAFLPGIAIKSGIDLSIRTEELRLYGSLNLEQQAGLRRRPLDLSPLPQFRKLLDELVYVGEWGSNFGRYEVTELYPRGLPDSMVLTLVSDQTSESVQAVSSDPSEFSFYSPSLSAEKLGQSLALPASQNWTSYLRIQTRKLELRLNFGNGISQKIDLTETLQVDPNPVPFERLSASFRQAAEAARQEAIRNPKSGVANPPPPR